MSHLPDHPTPKVRRADGSLWEASWNENMSWVVGLFDGSRSFFFRKLEPNASRHWWCPWRPQWRRTGETWEGRSLDAAGFSIL